MTRSTPSSARARNSARTCTSTPAASPSCASDDLIQAVRGPSGLRVSVLHELHAHRRGVLPGDDPREELRAGHQPPRATRTATDGRRGDGHLRQGGRRPWIFSRATGCPSACPSATPTTTRTPWPPTRTSTGSSTTGALFAWIFTYMPVGKGAPTELMPTPDDRELLYHFNRRVRADEAHPDARLPARRRVRRRLHRRRTPLSAHQRGRRCGALRVHPLLQRQHPRAAAAGMPEEPACSWPTTKASPSTTTCCGPVRCSRIPTAWKRWSRGAAPTAPTSWKRKAPTSWPRNAVRRPGRGRPRPSVCGRTAPTSARPTEHASSAAWPTPTRRSSRGSAAPCTGPSIRTAPWTRWHWSRRWPMS